MTLAGPVGAQRPAGLIPAVPSSAPDAASDSGQVFSLSDLLTFVALRHPVARQAGLLPERALQEVRYARGLFDPAATSKYYGKTFGGKDYFHDWDSQLRVPLWFGADLKAGFDRGVGPYVNPESYTSPAGLSYVGLSVPLAQGLLIDERRASVRQAQALQGLAEAERRGALNKLLLQAAKDYWDWSLNYQRLQLLDRNTSLANTRFEAVRQRVRLGDLAAIDSVEALTELQNRQATLTQARVQFRNSTLLLSNYLWNEQNQPLELPEATRPQVLPGPAAWQPLAPDSVAALTELAQRIHPELQKSRAKISQLGVERRLLSNKLLPKLSVDYNLLQAGQPFNPEKPASLSGSYLQNNYKLGVSFAYPLLLRQERAKLQLNRLKLRETELDLQQDTREIQTGVRTVANEWEALREQLRLQEQVVGNAERLRAGEQVRFENGESSVFLLNARESSLVTARVKLAELQAKYAQTQATLRWAAGGVEP
ncbi:TolC family protein [Hymenobacter psychrotolerans]|uniref:Outer membrane efflux protein n=1 Tax=Hymenobacter psychrotolerans DSM 18569 TaxID=1121959 RepID=A0A1M6V6G5_9BACT|nr:TolC family protein [Hymenobacter psychrotolerans]SHK76926.1 Outer membrane efflux protein [Hymenobacter psychrotolerans DSM 18569]